MSDQPNAADSPACAPPPARIFAAVLLAAVVALFTLPSWGEPSTMRKIVELMTLIALAQMWNLLAGFGGVVSVGQQAFVGLGMYGMIVLVNVHGHNLYCRSRWQRSSSR